MEARRDPASAVRDADCRQGGRREARVEPVEQGGELPHDVVAEIVRQFIEIPEMQHLQAEQPDPGEGLCDDKSRPLTEPEPGRLHRRQRTPRDLRGACHEIGVLELGVGPHEGRRHVQTVGELVIADEEDLAAAGRQQHELAGDFPVPEGDGSDHHDRAEGEGGRRSKTSAAQTAAEYEGEAGQHRSEEDEVIAIQCRHAESNAGEGKPAGRPAVAER